MSSLVRPFYRALIDHSRVQSYPNVNGVGCNVFFLTHGVAEDAETAMATNTKSKTNRFEAEFCCRLALHIALQVGRTF